MLIYYLVYSEHFYPASTLSIYMVLAERCKGISQFAQVWHSV